MLAKLVKRGFVKCIPMRSYSEYIKVFKDLDSVTNHLDTEKPLYSVILVSSDWNPL